MERAMWRGLLVAILLFSLIPLPAMASSLTVTASLDTDTLVPGAEVVVRGTVKKDTGSLPELVQGAIVTAEVVGTDISVNDTTDNKGQYTISFHAPSEVGEYTVTIFAEKEDLFGETTATLNVETLPTPDISVSRDGISFWPQDPVTDTKVLVNATVRNLGDLDANTSVRIFLGEPFDGKLFHEENISVPAGGSVKVSEMWPAESGIHLFTVVADKVDPTDSNLTNNQANRTLEVEDVRPPDISEPLIYPVEPTSQDVISVLAHVEDDLALAEEVPVFLIYFVGEDGDENELPMNHTAQGFLAEVGPFPGGTFVSLKVRATDMANNTAETVWHRRDIFHSSITVHVGNATGTAGQSIYLNCSAEYEDGTPVAGQEAVLVLDGDEHKGKTDEYGVAVFNVTAPPSGTYEYTVYVNDKRLVANSSAVLTVFPVTHPDIMIVRGGITFSWEDVSEIEVTVILYNRGDASGDVHLEVFLGTPSKDSLLDESNITLAPGRFLYHSFVWSPGPGHHALVAVANCPGDSDLSNNIATAEVTVPPLSTVADDTSNGDGNGEDDDLTDTDESVTAWTTGQILISLGLGLLLALVAYAFLLRFMEWGKRE